MERVLVSLDEVHFIAIDATDLSFECGDEAPERPLYLSHHRMAHLPTGQSWDQDKGRASPTLLASQ